jgi:hypothetical protein
MTLPSTLTVGMSNIIKRLDYSFSPLFLSSFTDLSLLFQSNDNPLQPSDYIIFEFPRSWSINDFNTCSCCFGSACSISNKC